MGTFNISIVNQKFELNNEHECSTFEEARSEAIKGALQIGAAEIKEDNPLFGAEVSIGEGGKRLARYVIAIAVSPLNR